MKKILIFIFSAISSVLIHGMEEDPYNAKNKFGMTPLHMVHIIAEQSDRTLSEIDNSKASIAAFFIWNGGRVDVKDNAGKTPLEYIEQVKEKLPISYKIMMAGRDKQLFEDKISKPTNGAYEFSELMNMSNSMGGQLAADAWGNACAILLEHLPKDSKKE